MTQTDAVSIHQTMRYSLFLLGTLARIDQTCVDVWNQIRIEPAQRPSASTSCSDSIPNPHGASLTF
jgi:hypothetical protein